MLPNLKGKPLWYKTWAIVVALATVFVVVRLFFAAELQQVDHALLAFALVSGLLNLFLFPTEDVEQISQTKGAIIIATCFGIGLITALIL